MEKNGNWLKSLSVIMAAVVAMAAAGFYVLSSEGDEGWIARAGETVASVRVVEKQSGSLSEELINNQGKVTAGSNELSRNSIALATAAEDVPQVVVPEEPVVKTPTAVSLSLESKSESAPVEAVTETPAAKPLVSEMVAVEVDEPKLTAVPVSYSWKSSANYLFRMEVKVTNNGSEIARGVNVSVPLLENNSPYQATSLKTVNYDPVAASGRVSTFNVGDIAPGETITIVADFDINVRTILLNSSNETIERARKIFDQYAGPGNCRDLALAFISKCREQGITAREVIGFARTQRGAMTSGSLQGARHSWAEFYVDGLGWIPVDLTFQYFGSFPHTSHVVESYSDQSLKVTYTGGNLNASWSNTIM